MAKLVKTENGVRWIEDAQWNESDHPRDDSGRFSSGGAPVELATLMLVRNSKSVRAAKPRNKRPSMN